MPDPLKYFRVEAREIVEQLQAALLALERGQEQVATIARLLRLAHTLKGAARVVKQTEIATLAHRMEDQLVPHRDSAQPFARELIDALLANVDEIAGMVANLAPPPAAAPAATTASGVVAAPATAVAPAAPAAAEEPRSAMAALDHVESLTDGVAEIGLELGSLRQALPVVSECRNLVVQLLDRLSPQRAAEWSQHGAVAARGLGHQLEGTLAKLARELENHVERATRELRQVRDRVDQLRLVAAGSMFGALERVTRDCAVSVGKQALFQASGGDVRLDADVLASVQRALVQAVRNAVAHGIEPGDERDAKGKPAQGRIRLSVSRRGEQILFVCDDDGRGVNLAEVRREARRLGRVAAAVEPSPDELLSLLLQGGISTSPQVSEVAGRGVGLDLIREALASVGGSVVLRTQSGHGTSLELTVPASLSALDALLVEAEGELFALPLKSVLRASRLSVDALSRTSEATSITVDEEIVPFYPLALLLRMPQAERERQAWTTVVIRAGGRLLALGVDGLRGAESVVVRGLPSSVKLDGTVSGVTLDADGNPRPLLDPDGLLAATADAPMRTPHGKARKRTVLVIDDSLTTRMLEQSILESAGYEVQLATSAEEGLEMARERRYDLFLVDVEMPGMDGFAFVQRTRADPQLARTPAVLVTSRASPEDLARGRQVGASGHIAKGEFDQVEFLEHITRLTR